MKGGIKGFWQRLPKTKIRDFFIECALYIGVLLISILAFLFFKPQIAVGKIGSTAQCYLVVGILLCVCVIAYLGMSNKLTAGRLIALLLLIGVLLRMAYMLYTPASYRQHDTFSKNHDGHEAYAWTIFSTGALPTENKYQFYHPPLNAMLQAGFMRIMSVIGEFFTAMDEGFIAKFNFGKPSYVDETRYFLYASCQCLAVLYSVITCMFSLKILKLFDFSDKTRVILSAFVIFYPRNIHFAGMLNNDPVAYMFGTLALYYALKWWKKGKSPAYILLCALGVGFGMMAKLSSATVCLPIAGIFIYEFIRTLRKKEGAIPLWQMVLQYGAFLLVCAPIGLWFQVYAKARFDQGFGYVWNNLSSGLYTGDRSFFERFFFTFDKNELFGSLWCKSFDNYNLFHFCLRSSIFGEQSYKQGEMFAIPSVLFAYAVCILLFIAIVWCIVRYFISKKQENGLYAKAPVSFKDLLFVFLLVQSQVISQIYFNISMPYGCTMDFRYIMPLILGVALTMGCVQKCLVADNGKVSIVLHRLLTVVTIGFLAASALFYCVLA